MAMSMEKRDEMIMRLVHYFITEENYSPIVVNGVRDEIWLQNQDGPYKIIRINGNYIHNKEQYDYDILKLNSVMRQVRRKTLSWSMNALNILLDVNEDVSLEARKNIASVALKNGLIKSKSIVDYFPDINHKMLLNEKGLDLMIDVTNDINRKTAHDNRVYESIFRPKKIVMTHLLIAINVLVFFVVFILSRADLNVLNLLRYGGIYAPLVKNGEIWRLITGGFLHGGIFHLLFNMYTLYVIGTQIENFAGKWKFLAIYFGSMLSASLMSCAIHTNTVSVGASGAIFGLLGALVYFGYHYRLYLGSVLRNQIIPLILLNLLLGFMMSGIDNAAHLGGLIGGLLISMALGVQKREDFKNRLNGIITFSLYILFLVYIVFFR